MQMTGPLARLTWKSANSKRVSEVFLLELLTRRVTVGYQGAQIESTLGPVILVRMNDITQILAKIEDGDPSAAQELLPLVYEELRKLAAAKLADEKAGQTLQATALVHDAYLRLVAGDPQDHWNGRGHFFGAAALAMRRILVEQARRKQRQKHGGGLNRVPLDEVEIDFGRRPEAVLELDEALTKLETEFPGKAQVVQLRFFAGMKHEEIAEALGLAEVTARRHWRFARAWLRRELAAMDESLERPESDRENSERI